MELVKQASLHASLSLGANMGNAEEAVRGGIRSIHHLPGAAVDAVSRFYRTAPVEKTDQNWFVNAAVRIRTSLLPEELLGCLLKIETAAGRDRSASVRFGPRPLDIDILFYGNRIIHTNTLRIPHPRMHKRRFVLAPLCDIDPEFRHPELRTSVSGLLKALDDPAQEMAVLPERRHPCGYDF
ncbi:MAG: 2-amino-4-hydroxy-6-hydroxymethyldihydropteridine diphosphokinase [Desulfobacterales bacterium]|nr:MAG: 2-amino-4-hydroxy-6-hydroxymethyldihydropteridine diphosphokinase [Desulfobacterales bacterium]